MLLLVSNACLNNEQNLLKILQQITIKRNVDTNLLDGQSLQLGDLF